MTASPSLVVVGDPQQATRRHEDGQLTERRVDRGIGHVQEPSLGGTLRERASETRTIQERIGLGLAQPLLELGHRSTSVRNRRRPALTFCRAASSLMPIRSPTSRYARSKTNRCTSAARCFAGQRAHGAPQAVVGGPMRWRRQPLLDPIQVSGPMALPRANRIGRLALRDHVEPGPQVVGVAQPRIGAQRREERLLQAVLRVNGADAGDQEAMQLGGVVVDQPLERGQLHTE